MQLVLAIIVLALIAGLLGLLWYVITNPRRRADQIAAELAEPADRTSRPLVVGYRRAACGAAAILFGLMAANVAVRAQNPPMMVCCSWCLSRFARSLFASPCNAARFS